MASQRHGNGGVGEKGAPWSGIQGPISAGMVLVLSKLSVNVEQITVPKVGEALTKSFSTIESMLREVEGEPAFSVHYLATRFRQLAESLLRQYVDMQWRKLSLLLRKAMATPNWLKCKEPHDVRMVADLFLQEVDEMEDEVEQLLPPGSDRSLWHRHMAKGNDSTRIIRGSKSNDRHGAVVLGKERGDLGMRLEVRGRSRLLERDVAKLFKERVELLTKLEFTEAWVVSTVVKMSLKTWQEYSRLQTFGKWGYQQMLLDTHFLRAPLKSYVDNEAAVESLLDEVLSAASERSVDPSPLDSVVLQQMVEDHRNKM